MEHAVIRLTLLFLLASTIPTATRASEEPAPKPLAITQVTVIDTTGGPSMADMTVIVTGDRITALGKAKEAAVPKDATVIDGKGKFLIPGLWDMHVHGINPDLLLSNGVTGVRLMWGGPRILEIRGEFDKGTPLGPRVVTCGNIFDGPRPVRDATLKIATAAEGRQAVRDSKKDGYDFIKVYSLLHREPFLAIVDEAKKQGLPVAGHVPEFVSVAEASDAGLKCMEHLNGILPACSRIEAEMRKELTETMMKHDVPPSAVYALRQAQTKQLLDTYSDENAKKLFARLAKNGTWQCPTLTVLRAVGYLDDPEFTNDARLKYIPPRRREGWKPENDFRLKTWTKKDFAQQRTRFHKELELLGRMHRSGVPILAGTDAGNPYCFQGFSLHDELELLVKAGLKPMQALQTATLNPARYLERQKDFGTIELGKLADLVLLDADPLKDIKNTKKIASVIVRGKLLIRKELDKMLADVEAEAGKK
jgi:imidazolonepropionase-like amidohydrolase